MNNKSIFLNRDVLKSFNLGEIIRSGGKGDVFDSLDFSKDGEFLVSAKEDNLMRVYNCSDAKLKSEIASEKYGCRVIKFTHSNNYVLFASRNNFDYSLRYLGLVEKQFVRYYKGHRSKILSIELSPISDNFVSSSYNSVRFWDLRTSSCQGKMLNTKGNPFVAYDPKGLVIAVACRINTIKLFSVRSYEAGPFKTIVIGFLIVFCFLTPKDDNPLEIRGLKFSPDGVHLLLICSNSLFLINSFNGKKLWRVEDKMSKIICADFSPNSKFVICGNDNCEIKMYDVKWDEVKNSNLIQTIDKTGHDKPIVCTRFNPKYCMFATSSKEINLWIPFRE